jgi:hypothetical protein
MAELSNCRPINKCYSAGALLTATLSSSEVALRQDRQMTIMVTGGAGYIGSHTCVELIGAGYLC